MLVDEHAAGFGAFVPRDDPTALEHVDQAPCARVADSQAALQERHGGGLRLDDDLDRPLEQRILVRVEVLVPLLEALGRRLRRLEQRLVQLLAPLAAALLDEEGDLLLGDVGALDALQARGAERLEEHVALAEEALRPGLVEDHPRVRLAGDREGDPGRDVRLDHPGDHVTEGRCVASTRWIPTARDFCASRMTASSTCCGEIIIRSASSSMTTSRYGSVSSPRWRKARFASGRLRARTVERRS